MLLEWTSLRMLERAKAVSSERAQSLCASRPHLAGVAGIGVAFEGLLAVDAELIQRRVRHDLSAAGRARSGHSGGAPVWEALLLGGRRAQEACTGMTTLLARP